jgi:CHAT domain-containing protein/tetratricopeptide (TPR) repeat protein
MPGCPRAALAIVLAIGIPGSMLAVPAQQPPADSELVRATQLLTATREAIDRTDTAAARTSGLAALEIFERRKDDRGIGEANRLLGIAANIGGDQAESIARFRSAMAAFESAGDRRGRALAAHGLTGTLALPADEERRIRQQSIDDARAVGDRRLEAIFWHAWGDRSFSDGQYAVALEKLQTAMSLLDTDVPDDRDELGTIYNSLGRLYRAHGQVETALEYQLKALAIHEGSRSPLSHLQSLNAVAVTYRALDDLERARSYSRRALVLAEQSSSPRIQDFLRANFAGLLSDSGDDPAEVAHILEGVLARGLDVYRALRYRHLSEAYLKLDRSQEALTAARAAVDSCGAAESLECIRALDQRSAAHAAVGNMAAALADVGAALRTVETARTRLVPTDFFKQQFNVALEETYSRAIALHLRERQPAEALETAELARSRGFLDLLASRDLRWRENAKTDTAPLVLRGATLPSAIAAPAVKVAELAATATRLRSTLVVYWVAADTVSVWVVAPGGGLHVSTVNVTRSRLSALVRSTVPFSSRGIGQGDGSQRPAQGGITTRGANTIAPGRAHAPAWRELHALLIAPIRHVLPRRPGALITIVPHGPLTALAFAALQDERGRYLLEDYTLHYAPAGGVFQFTAGRRHAGARTGSMLMAADPVPPTLSALERPLPRLPGARAEARAIARLVPRTRVTLLEGANVDERSVRNAAAGQAVLHFATHAIVRDDDPFSSFLALGPARDEADGLLTAAEIYELRLDADLVVLSACRSAGGRISGDGIAAFARAFIYGGAPSIVASLWDVADEPTNRLLPAFYRTWLAGSSKARALRAAQLQLLRDLRAGAVRIETPAGLVSLAEQPVFWAGFALLGEPE